MHRPSFKVRGELRRSVAEPRKCLAECRQQGLPRRRNRVTLSRRRGFQDFNSDQYLAETGYFPTGVFPTGVLPIGAFPTEAC